MRWLALAVTLAAGQAQALSCLRPDPAVTFDRVAAAPESYYVLYGQLAFDTTRLPPGVRQNLEADPTPIPARFSGRALGAEGFTLPYAADVTLLTTCLASWCGSAPAAQDVLIFARADGDRPFIESGPCGGTIFQDVDAATLDRLTRCLQDGGCGTSGQEMPLD